MSAETAAVLETKQLVRIFTMGKYEIHAVRSVDLTVCRNEFVVLMGSSGSGKSTLLSLLGCLDMATSGSYLFEGQEVRIKKRSSATGALVLSFKITTWFLGTAPQKMFCCRCSTRAG